MEQPSWSSVKTEAAKLDSPQLLSLLSDLYKLSKENKNFLQARLTSSESSLKAYKKIISDCLYPDIYKNHPVQISKAKKAVSDFIKARSDPADQAEVMVFFVEQGNDFTLEYGDMDEGFYSALALMYHRAANKVCELPVEIQRTFKGRLAVIVSSSTRIGWGYHDEVSDIYSTAFSDRRSPTC